MKAKATVFQCDTTYHYLVKIHTEFETDDMSLKLLSSIYELERQLIT